MFDVAAARAALSPIDWANPAVPAGALADYVRHYGLDFGGRIAGLRHGIGTVRVTVPDIGHDYRIAVQLFQVPQPRGTVLVLHGYYDHVGIFDHVIEHLLSRGFDVIAFDLPGHGLSGGEPASIGDFSEYQQVFATVLEGAVRSRLIVPLSIVAQSTGGAIVMEWLLRTHSTSEESPFAHVVLLAPLVRPVNWGMNRRVHTLISLFRKRIARKFAVNSHDPEFLRFLREDDPLQSHDLSVCWVGALKRWIPLIEAATPCDYPLVVIQGDEDGTVDWRHNLSLIGKKFPRMQAHMVATGRHQMANESPELRREIFARIDAQLLQD